MQKVQLFDEEDFPLAIVLDSPDELAALYLMFNTSIYNDKKNKAIKHTIKNAVVRMPTNMRTLSFDMWDFFKDCCVHTGLRK
jgi:hypothetical protein